MSDIRIRRTNRYQDIPASSPVPSASVPQTKVGMHWVWAFLLVYAASAAFAFLNYFFLSPFTSALTSFGFSDYSVYYILYFGVLVFGYTLRVFWISLTYKRYHGSVVWEIYTLLSIVLHPVILYFNELLRLVNYFGYSQYVLSNIALSISLLLAIAPVVYMIYVCNKFSKES